MQSWCRLIGGLAAMLGAVVFVSTAAAAPPEKSEFSNVAFGNVLSGVCPFDVNVQSVVSGFEIDYFDGAGNIVRAQIHQVEQDTFTANGKTLTGIPFTFNLDHSDRQQRRRHECGRHRARREDRAAGRSLFVAQDGSISRSSGRGLPPVARQGENRATWPAFCAALSP